MQKHFTGRMSQTIFFVQDEKYKCNSNYKSIRKTRYSRMIVDSVQGNKNSMHLTKNERQAYLCILKWKPLRIQTQSSTLIWHWDKLEFHQLQMTQDHLRRNDCYRCQNNIRIHHQQSLLLTQKWLYEYLHTASLGGAPRKSAFSQHYTMPSYEACFWASHLCDIYQCRYQRLHIHLFLG